MPDITSLFQGSDAVNRNLFNQKISDINAHGNDTARHVTEKEREVWNKKANGNNAVWVATSTVANIDYPNNMWYVNVPNFVFTEGCQVTFKPPTRPSGFPTNMIRVQDEYNPQTIYIDVALRTPQKGSISPDAWTEDSLVTVTLSRTIIKLGNVGDERGGTAFFTGNSIAKDTQTVKSALTVSTAVPSSYIGDGKMWGVY